MTLFNEKRRADSGKVQGQRQPDDRLWEPPMEFSPKPPISCCAYEECKSNIRDAMGCHAGQQILPVDPKKSHEQAENHCCRPLPYLMPECEGNCRNSDSPKSPRAGINTNH